MLSFQKCVPKNAVKNAVVMAWVTERITEKHEKKWNNQGTIGTIGTITHNRDADAVFVDCVRVPSFKK